ncbi:hypothetical protein QQP08_020387 [Theobroma cacao]|uniref:Uncharacterized protein n=1 Tax=Theobroma cacao TaxID=3641 RepID=A0A061GD82_THECC|nr:Uncharacterized protein TCM_029225 [Theobroma cacao]WRX27900.1 hypothetical protein QQP08_020387 [Theobroma cacao]
MNKLQCIFHFDVNFRKYTKKGGRKFGVLAMGIGFSAIHEINQEMQVSPFQSAQHYQNCRMQHFLKFFQELNVQLEGYRYAKQDINVTATEILSNPEIYGRSCGIFFLFEGGSYSMLRHWPVQKKFQLWGTEGSLERIAELLWSGTANNTGPYNLKALFEA